MRDFFVKTTDAETAQKLIDAGLQLVDKSSGVFTFLNKPIMTFDEQTDKNTITTNAFTV